MWIAKLVVLLSGVPKKSFKQVKISEPVDDRRADFLEKCANLRQPYYIHKDT